MMKYFVSLRIKNKVADFKSERRQKKAGLGKPAFIKTENRGKESG
jgi:hypothetical protein